MRIITVLILILLTAFSSYGQSGKKKKKRKQRQNTETSQPTSVDPGFPQKDYAPKPKKASKGPTYESEQQYYERMDEREKTRRKNEKMMDKPQYSDPTYFGHKRPPKKRPPGKMKYCKVCGIKH
jgi:hypothetical protein